MSITLQMALSLDGVEYSVKEQKRNAARRYT
jgi:hypothetical protein